MEMIVIPTRRREIDHIGQKSKSAKDESVKVESNVEKSKKTGKKKK